MKTKANSDTRQRIVDTASRLFYSQGYNSTGINQVIDEAGVAKASLYQHFSSKEDLLVEYLSNASATSNEAISKVVSGYDTPKDKVLAVFDFLIKLVKHPEYDGCNFLNILSEVPYENNRIRKIIKTQKDHIKKMFREILEPAGKKDLEDEVYLLFDGALIASKVQGNSQPVVTAKKILEKIL